MGVDAAVYVRLSIVYMCCRTFLSTVNKYRIWRCQWYLHNTAEQLWSAGGLESLLRRNQSCARVAVKRMTSFDPGKLRNSASVQNAAVIYHTQVSTSVEWMNEWMNEWMCLKWRYRSNCCRSTEQKLHVASVSTAVSENGSSHVRSSNDALNRTVLRSSHL